MQFDVPYTALVVQMSRRNPVEPWNTALSFSRIQTNLVTEAQRKLWTQRIGMPEGSSLLGRHCVAVNKGGGYEKVGRRCLK